MKMMPKIFMYTKNRVLRLLFLTIHTELTGIAIPSSAPYCVDTFDDEAKVRDDIRRAHKLADMVIVCPHWGTEYVYESTSYQDQWTNVFLEEGVDVVLGTHPHVIEPVKEFTRESDGHKMVVYYSLGNFVSNQDEITTYELAVWQNSLSTRKVIMLLSNLMNLSLS